MDDPLLTVRQVAQALQVSEKTVRRWIQEQRIVHATRISRRGGWRIPQSELTRLIESMHSSSREERR